MDWKQLIMGEEDFSFLWEVLLRTCIVFLFLIVMLRLTGKRGVKQLSIFEMVMVIALGSSAGDPMLYKEVGLLPPILIFTIILGIYRGIVFVITRSERFEEVFEGKTTYIVKEGVNTSTSKDYHEFASDEFFAELRAQGIEHLGQVKEAVLETNGEISVLFYPDSAVKEGLPIWPELYNRKVEQTVEPGTYACSNCGYVEHLEAFDMIKCSKCTNKKWVKAIATTRIS
ncbi:DUF421 domain-containing protein [Flavobacterium tegetincola]|uniref:DUF421 domain-containing protein n=1 Tax=Flavobacterium tegetincola TaxID=150172 RepID=UPI00041001B6|nr:YetF domain-containing protein [Flavobacterium tegetincola]